MHNGAGWFRLAKAAILRNENSRRTTFELVLLPHPPHLPLGASAPIHRVRRCLCPSPPRLQAMARSDLIGTTEEFAKRWKEGLRFGFSMLVNDGDDAVEQVVIPLLTLQPASLAPLPPPLHASHAHAPNASIVW